MARYIDADKLIAHLKDEIEGCKQPFGSRANGKGIAYGTELGLKSAISFAETLPTADVVPKSEGKWKKRGNEKTCSLCKFIYYSNNDEWNFCPNCGAKMKGE